MLRRFIKDYIVKIHVRYVKKRDKRFLRKAMLFYSRYLIRRLDAEGITRFFNGPISMPTRYSVTRLSVPETLVEEIEGE